MFPAAEFPAAPNRDSELDPLAVGTLDIDTGELERRVQSDPDAEPGQMFTLLRDRGWPLAVDVLAFDEDGAVGPLPNRRLAELPVSPAREATPVGPISVVVCTRNRSELLAASLKRLREVVSDADELLVVDNAPTDERTADVVDGFGGNVRRVVEPVPGLARARNRGLASVEHRFVVFTDDDIEPDPAWLDVIGATFAAHPGAVCVSGAVLPTSLSTPAELRFQEFGGYVADFRETEYHLGMDPPPSKLFPFHPRLLGTGANMAFRVEALRSIGGFDDALGTGTVARGGEDIDVAVRLLLAGHLLVRQPAAVLWHASLTTDAELRQQVEGYGCGLAAAFSKFLSNRQTAAPVLRRLPVGIRMALSDDSSKNQRRSASYPAELRRAELRGMAKGFLAYHRSRYRQRGTDRVGSP